MDNLKFRFEKKYLLFLICLYPVISSYIWTFGYYLDLQTGLSLGEADLNLNMAQSIVDNYSYVDLVSAFLSNTFMYLSFLFILIGVFFGDAIACYINNNTYYILRNRLSFLEFKVYIYKNVILNVFIIEMTLTGLIYLIAIAIAGLNPGFIFFVQTFLSFIFIFAYSILVLLITINLSFIIKNNYLLKVIPYITLYFPIVFSNLFFRYLPSTIDYTRFSYLSYVPYFKYSTTEPHVNLIGVLNGSLTPEQVDFLTSGISNFLVPYILLISIFIITFNCGKKVWYV